MGSFVRQMNVSIFCQTWMSAIHLMKGLVSDETVVLCQWGINAKILFQNSYQNLYPQRIEFLFAMKLEPSIAS